MLGSLADIEKQAREEVAHEEFLLAVDAAKVRIREAMKRKRWWHKFFPFTIKIHMERLPNV